jgi:sulfoxide reductase heme-binding subunit YedZ
MRRPKVILFCLCLIPLANLIWKGVAGNLGANPVEYVIRYLGDWGLRFLLITLSVTPLRILTKNGSFAQYRRMLGLYAFFYVALHLLMFFIADLGGSPAALWHEVLKRRFIMAGMAAFIILCMLAATSTNNIIKRLGAEKWKKIHRWIYIAAPLAALHYYWMTKADKAEPLLYAAILSILLLFRVYRRFFFRRPGSAT